MGKTLTAPACLNPRFRAHVFISEIKGHSQASFDMALPDSVLLLRPTWLALRGNQIRGCGPCFSAGALGRGNRPYPCISSGSLVPTRTQTG